ncbi:UPF0669 protein C6orf120 homolog [Watersipora subatra]|uniref:UPF0669 protein C6orf120 homolog n=1 Tax=Watersipora subatra TaxID=2589382 RepID=UPI00355B2E45
MLCLSWLTLISLVSAFAMCSLAYTAQLIQAVEGSVGAESFLYYSYADPGPLIVVLKSISGDADLYVSSSTKTPTYIDYEVKSNTCGVDMLDLSDMKRPVYIGVFGSHAYDTTNYTLYAYRIDGGVSETDDSQFEDRNSIPQATHHREPPDATETNESSFWPFFEFLLTLLEFFFQALL